MRLLHSRAALLLTILLLAEGVVYYATAARPEHTPVIAPLDSFPSGLPGWRLAQTVPIEKEVQDVLKADDTLNRVYESAATGQAAVLFIAYFRTQRTGAAPHSPKNCLPGSGWEPVETPGTVSIPVSGRASPLVANRYIVARGDQKSVVIYWYQSHDRIIAHELSAKFWLIADALRYNRSDTALVKVVVPIGGREAVSGVSTASEFVQAAYPALAALLPR